MRVVSHPSALGVRCCVPGEAKNVSFNQCYKGEEEDTMEGDYKVNNVKYYCYFTLLIPVF